jgi:hypothetical protein
LTSGTSHSSRSERRRFYGDRNEATSGRRDVLIRITQGQGSRIERGKYDFHLACNCRCGLDREEIDNISGENDLIEALDVELLGSIQADTEERGGSSNAYVVPMRKLLICGSDTDERCVVVVGPRASRKDIHIERARVYTDVRITPDRKQRACLMLVDGAVALTETAVVGAAPLQHGPLIVLWMFADEIALSEYAYPAAVNEALQRASRVADVRSHQEQRGGSFPLARRQTVMEMFDSFDVDSSVPS